MSSFYKITKVSLINSMGIVKLFKSGKSGEKNKGIFVTIGICIGILLVAILPFIYATAIADILMPYGLIDLLLLGAIVLSSVVTFITSIVKAQGILFSSKDYEMLMSLPIKQSVILTSKMMQLLILNYLFTALILIPTAIVYFNRVDISLVFYIYLMVAFIFVPLVPIVVSSIIAFILSYFSSKVKLKNLFSVIANFVVIILVMVLFTNIDKVVEVVSTSSESIVASIGKIYPPALYFTNALIDLSISNLLIFIIVSVVPFMIFLFIFSKFYNSIMSKLGESFKATNYKLTTLKVEYPIKSLIKKELKQYFSCPIYILNTSFMVVLITIASFASVFVGRDMLSEFIKISGVEEVLPLVMIGALTLIVCMSCTTSSSISLEGKNLWILKSLPIDEMDIFKAKIIVNLLILIPAILLNSCVLLISLKMSLIDFLWMIIIPSLYALVISIGGILINLHFPKLEWTSEITVVKQSVSVIISILGGMLLVAIPVGILMIGKITAKNLYLICLSIVLIGLIVFLIRYLNTRGRRLFKEL